MTDDQVNTLLKILERLADSLDAIETAVTALPQAAAASATLSPPPHPAVRAVAPSRTL